MHGAHDVRSTCWLTPSFRLWKKTLDGPGFAVPLIGSIVEMVKNPYDFWEKQRLFNPDGLSWNSIVGQFMVMSTNTEITRKIFMHNGEDSFRLFLHPNGWKILGTRWPGCAQPCVFCLYLNIECSKTFVELGELRCASRSDKGVDMVRK
jgi:hypothetical protein